MKMKLFQLPNVLSFWIEHVTLGREVVTLRQTSPFVL